MAWEAVRRPPVCHSRQSPEGGLHTAGRGEPHSSRLARGKRERCNSPDVPAQFDGGLIDRRMHK